MVKVGEFYGMGNFPVLDSLNFKNTTMYFKVLSVKTDSLSPNTYYCTGTGIMQYEAHEGKTNIFKVEKNIPITLDDDMFGEGTLWKITKENFKAIMENMFNVYRNLDL